MHSRINRRRKNQRWQRQQGLDGKETLWTACPGLRQADAEALQEKGQTQRKSKTRSADFTRDYKLGPKDFSQESKDQL